MPRIFIRPGYPTVTVDTDDIQVGHALADEQWRAFAREKAESLGITAEEYARQARRGLVAQHLENNAVAYAARPLDSMSAAAKHNYTAALFRQAQRAWENASNEP